MKTKTLLLIYVLAKLLFLAALFARLESRRIMRKARGGYAS